MERIDIEACLKSMEILVDTREQPSERAKKRYESFGCKYNRQTLCYGDYTYNFTLPDGTKLWKADDTVCGHAVIERKMDLAELSGCFTQSRDRFAREFIRASEHNASIYLLVENATWEKLINGRYGTQFKPEAFFASITAYMARYHIQVIFCQQELSGRIIRQILYRELKERLERGDYG